MDNMKDIFFKNLSLKFLSLLLACSLWVYVATVENRTDFFPGEIPIEVKNLAPTLAPVYDQDTVRIKISAPASVWNKLIQDDFIAYVDLEELSLGTHQIEVKVTTSVPGVQIVETDPEEIRVRIETAVTAQFQIVVNFEGELAPGYEVIDTEIKPEKVEAKGAKDIINSVSRATAIVGLTGEDRDIKQKVKLSALDEYERPVKNIFFAPERVEVSILVAKEGGGKIVGVKPKLVGSPASGYWISQFTFDPATVRILGSEEKMDDVDFLETKEINISGLNQDKELQLDLVLPEGISLLSGESKAITITIKVSLEAQAKEVTAGFSYTGLGSGLTVTNISPSGVQVMVSGSAGVLGSLSSDNVVVNLDLSGRGAGSHLISISKASISISSGAAIVSFVPNNVTVTIE